MRSPFTGLEPSRTRSATIPQTQRGHKATGDNKKTSTKECQYPSTAGDTAWYCPRIKWDPLIHITLAL